MRTRWVVALVLVLVAGLFAAACGGESNKTDGGEDGGLTPCVDDGDCESPETCDDDGYCRWDPNPDPDDNKLSGAFSVEMNGSYGMGEVSGKFDGRYVYLQYPGAEASFDPQADDMAIILVDGIVTSELLLRLKMKVPHDSPTETQIKFGVGGVATGTFSHMELNDNGYIVGDTPVAELIGGYIVFGEFGNGTGNPVNGTLSVELKKVIPPGD